MSPGTHTIHPPEELPLPLPEFAAALAEHLPGRWLPDPTTTLIADDPASNRIWDSGPLPYAAFETGDVRRAVLTSPHGLQLYVMPRPHRPEQYLVLPMLPAGTGHQHVTGLRAPRGIAVPADPVRAAAAVRRRFLVDYRHRSLPAWQRATPARLHMEVRFGADVLPRITCTYGRALAHLLTHGGFLLDPATGECHLPKDVSVEQGVRQFHRSVGRLESLGFTVGIHRPIRPARTPERFLPPSANRPQGRGR
ncbi:hypothetical protein AB0D14_32695 [Streptomyces sp. NPDC048484]|uniref:hypothetical protein n=1 Tax=Streptomyces sp. NPDC048484 TaxID=3155146 RepID=UPI00343180A7